MVDALQQAVRRQLTGDGLGYNLDSFYITKGYSLGLELLSHPFHYCFDGSFDLQCARGPGPGC
jgi:hypothetical protein